MKTITNNKVFWAVFATVLLSIPNNLSFGSDHDDGETDGKGRNQNITDVYAFREDSQTGNSADSGNLILIMNTNPRSLPEQQYYFSAKSVYEFHIGRAAKKTAPPTGADDVQVQVRFSRPSDKKQQAMNIRIIKDGKTIKDTWKTSQGRAILTTDLLNSQAGNLTVNEIGMDGRKVRVFAGHREDPFFFDVEQFFKVRGAAVKTGTLSVGFSPPETARDFTKNYNVNAIVLSIPLSLIEKSGAKSQALDVWTTISLDGKQIERLGRPAVNEGLVLSNKLLNAFNSIPPKSDFDVSNPAVLAVLKEASASLDLFDSLDGKENFANGFDSEVVKGFLPDVMRIDPNISIAVDKAAYNGDFVINDLGAPMLTGGRKITDDVIDITLGYLVLGDPSGTSLKDNVSYEGVAGNPSQGHRLLHGQTAHGQAAKFPFLAQPH